MLKDDVSKVIDSVGDLTKLIADHTRLIAILNGKTVKLEKRLEAVEGTAQQVAHRT